MLRTRLLARRLLLRLERSSNLFQRLYAQNNALNARIDALYIPRNHSRLCVVASIPRALHTGAKFATFRYESVSPTHRASRARVHIGQRHRAATGRRRRRH